MSDTLHTPAVQAAIAAGRADYAAHRLWRRTRVLATIDQLAAQYPDVPRARLAGAFGLGRAEGRRTTAK
jgi:hypothetical protein